MSNPDFSENKRGLGGRARKPPPTGTRSTTAPKFTEKTAAWPGLPGSTGPNRSAGVKKIRAHPKSEGL